MKIKICGLSRIEDIQAVNSMHIDYAGFIFVSKSRRYVTPYKASALKAGLSPEIKAVGVFANEQAESILELVEKQIIDVVQLHGNETTDFIDELKRRKDVCIIKAISMTEDGFERELKCWEESSVDFLLLDSGKGGTGMQFDYRRIRRLSKPFFLAGGLNPDNVGEAAMQTRPLGVDLNSGVETDGYKDKEKINQTVRRIRDVEGKIW